MNEAEMLAEILQLIAPYPHFRQDPVWAKIYYLWIAEAAKTTPGVKR
ncbi:MAG TPA: hypothetical protein VGB85_28695 [Nannocystis sp.]|jgi:hypothetical protein